MRSVRFGIAAASLALSLSLLASCAPREVRVAPPAAPPRAEVRGVAVPTGIDVPLEGATVTVGGRTGAVAAGGAFSLSGIETGKQHLVVEKTFPSGKIRRILGVSTIYVSEAPLAVNVPVRDATDVDAFCLECHPPLGKARSREQKIRDAHPSGVVARTAVGDRSLLDAQGRVTCESCHTVHRGDQYPLFGVGEIKKGSFCNRCHSSRKK
jgi:hypothetical protein